MKHIKLQTKQEFGIDGQHRLSICDIRAPGAAALEREIVAFANQKQAEIDRTIREILRARALTLSREDEAWTQPWLEQLKYLRQHLQNTKANKFLTLEEMYAELRRIAGVRVLDIHNIIPTAGRSVIARWIIGDNTYDADSGANYGSLGTSNTAVSNADTQLGAETYRKARSSESQTANVAVLSNFYTAAEVVGTFEEAGWHIAGSGTVNSGQLLSHFLTGTLAKASNETLTVESTLTIS